MTSKAARFPSGTKASLSTVADSRAVGDCGWKADSEEALPLFPQEAEKPTAAE